MSDLFSLLRTSFKPHSGLDADSILKKLPSIASGWKNADARLALHFYSASPQVAAGALWFLIKCNGFRWLVVSGAKSALNDLQGEQESLTPTFTMGIFPCTAVNAEVIRNVFEWLRPRTYGFQTTFGCGDRLGLATPGHIRAARACGVNVLLAQQSIREMARTSRTPQQVMDDAMWAVFQEGYTAGFGSDADHLKTFNDIEVTAATGFTMFTIDPSEHVDRAADSATPHEIDEKLATVHTPELPVDVAKLLGLYADKTFDIPGLGKLTPSIAEMKRAIIKYGRAIAHTDRMAQHIAWVMPGRPYDLEMSVDETDHPTTPVEHLFVGLELRRRGVNVHSLALRFVGEFQKGIDYIGDIQEFEKSFATQFAIAKFCGDYKMSIHSGSDKFTIFPIIGRIAGSRVHEKTAGTSYLEALRTAARLAPAFFREVWQFALGRYDNDRATYHVAEKLTSLPDITKLPDSALDGLFNNDHARQLLHVTFGSVLNEKTDSGELRFKNTLFQVLRDHEEAYAELLEAHFIRHMRSLGMAQPPVIS